MSIYFETSYCPNKANSVSEETPLPISNALQDNILEHLIFLYGTDEASEVASRLMTILGDFMQRNPHLAQRKEDAQLTQRDAVLITYGDQFHEQDISPLESLRRVLIETFQRIVSAVHILPFFPYSSDDGFSIIDYLQVNPELGDWTDVEHLGYDFRLMFDAVINHISRESEWFQQFLAGNPTYEDWFIALDPGAPADWTSQVVRPRALPLLTPVQTTAGEKLVWTTFSEDQIDLNYAQPAVLLRMIQVLLFYVEKGAQIIRLDAIAYLCKKIGTTSIHLEETHRVIKLLRCTLDAVAPDVILITETNVPHEQNISYFGTPLPETGRTDEAQMVYQFPLAPLVMHSILSGDARTLTEWAAGLERPSPQATFFNFTASHDGIGIMPARGLLDGSQIQVLVDATLAHGGRVSYRTNPDGSQTVYELNISFFDALSNPSADEPQGLQVARFMVSQAIMLAMAGVPGIYVHSLLGSRSWHDGVALTGHNRTINRQKLDRASLESELSDPNSLRSQVFGAYSRFLRARSSDPAFHPYGTHRVLSLDDSVLAFLRISPDGESRVLCLHNVSDQTRPVHLCPREMELLSGAWHDLLAGSTIIVGDAGLTLPLLPYAVRWLKA